MQKLGTMLNAREKVWLDAQQLIQNLKTLCAKPVADVSEAITLLMQLREETAEDINQIQHEHMILAAADWLIKEEKCKPETVWFWNPRQTGGANEPDLRGAFEEAVTVSAEITTSLLPQGKIDERMAGTLLKLSSMEGARYYFVRTEAMAVRARTKIFKAGHSIKVVRLLF